MPWRWCGSNGQSHKARERMSRSTAAMPASKAGSPDTFIIGDSAVRDVSERGLCGVAVRMVAGARVGDVGRLVGSAGGVDWEGVRTVILHVGSHDCTEDGGPERAAAAYRGLLGVLGERAPGAARVLSTVCPRRDSPGNQARVDSLNRAIRQLAREHGCLVVDHDNNFKMKDDSVDPSLLGKGGLHLTQAGTLRLLRNMQAVVPGILPASDRTKRERGGPRRGRSRDDGCRGPRHSAPEDGSGGRPCEYCGETNHSARRCKFEAPLICHNCFRSGHKSRMCRMDRGRTRNGSRRRKNYKYHTK